MIIKWIVALILIGVFFIAGVLTILLVDSIKYIFFFVFSVILVFASMFLIRDILRWFFSLFNGRID